MRWRVGHARGTGTVGVAVAEDGVDGEPWRVGSIAGLYVRC